MERVAPDLSAMAEATTGRQNTHLKQQYNFLAQHIGTLDMKNSPQKCVEMKRN